ncbi:MAG: hypothetical protein EP340_10415 [Alphaproteobacteria bacterium]|nr:MAG: hypothetical protein EP340_10415 [Alphaproteobacteria bacterium]
MNIRHRFLTAALAAFVITTGAAGDTQTAADLKAAYKRDVVPALDSAFAAEDQTQAALRTYRSWLAEMQAANIDDMDVLAELEDGLKRLDTILTKWISASEKECIQNKDPYQVNDMIQWESERLALGLIEESNLRDLIADCAQFTVAFRSEIRSEFSDFTVTSVASGTVPLTLDETGLFWTGASQPLVLEDYSTTRQFTGSCSAEFTGGNATMSVPGLTLGVLTSSRGDDGDKEKASPGALASLTLSVGMLPQFTTQHCPDQPDMKMPSPHFSPLFYNLHQDTYEEGFGVLFDKGWEEAADPFLAALVQNSQMIDDMRVVEETEIEIRHTPAGAP